MKQGLGIGWRQKLKFLKSTIEENDRAQSMPLGADMEMRVLTLFSVTCWEWGEVKRKKHSRILTEGHFNPHIAGFVNIFY
ncbi:hypothetical protein RO575_08535 [Methylomonas sp. MO1]|uniref:hypothetical protein n=1 Tax=Methylomonas sp. MO1 TaxID=3073619 RepID=UPI0028A32C7C|nr:hypothetical protein [Methylomonas sp. MO1]MDT4289603.1 hypothetical protein [Methylomonas sp. MO1]